ncbi:Calx-beta domain-containing protein [[Empedobacter] haloabium]|uniref:Calx-beta domain-containing protein n=1 Tax=[Empedobacter] haloabium TaxID=592317 RepID=A0ABZ1ULE4_9BURK
MAVTTVSVSFANGFFGNASKSNESSSTSYLTSLGWSNLQFQQATNNGQFGGSQGNDYSGTIIVTDALGVVHRINGVINWRAPSGDVSTIVFYATGAPETLAKAGGGTVTVDPWTGANNDPHSYIGLTFNGQSLTIGNDGTVSGNAATQGLLASLNTYLNNQPHLTVGDAVVNEAAGTATVTITLDKVTADTVTVKYATQNGTASAGTDYTAASGTLTFLPGETSKTIQVPILDNGTVDGVRTANVVLSDSTFAAITDNTGVVTINDNDGAPYVGNVVAEDASALGANPVDSTVVEGGSLVYTVIMSRTGGGEFALTLGGSAASADRAALSFSDGVTWKNGNPASGIVVIPASVGSFKVTVAAVDDSEIENAETVVLTVGGVSATGTITDNDSQSVTSVTAEDALNVNANPVDSTVVEGMALRYTVALNGASPVPTEHALTLGGTASGSDLASLTFTNGVAWKNGAASSGIVVVPAGVTGFQALLTTSDDTVIETSETVTLTVAGVTGTGTITDNDSQSVTTVVAEDSGHLGQQPVDSAVVEGVALVYTVALNGPSPTAVEHVLTVGGTAAPADLGALVFSGGVAWKNSDPGTGIVIVPANVTGFTVTLPTVDDVALESAESVVLTVGGVAATGTLTDNDSQSVVTVVAEDAGHPNAFPLDTTVVEGGTLLYTVTLNMASGSASEYSLAQSGTALAGDLGAITFSNGVTWKNGDPTGGIVVVPASVTSFTIAVATVDDSVIEAAETLVLTVGGVMATGTITDNDVLAVTSVSARDAANLGANPADRTVVEGNTLVYTVALNGVGVAPTEFALGTAGTASAADLGSFSFSDGVGWKNGDPATHTLVVPAGVATFTITVATVDDALVEQAESLVLSVGGVAGTGTIDDNDVASTPPTPTPPAPTPTPPTPPAPPVLNTALDPTSDDGSSNTDAVTSVLAPEFTVAAGTLLTPGGSVRLLAPSGAVVGTTAVTAQDIASGKINVGTGQLDDGVYTFTAQVLDATGKVVGSAPVSVTIVTDVDGVMPSVELAANGGDYNHDGVLDWQQHTVAQMPLKSLADFASGKDAAASSFGAILSGSLSSADGAVALTSGAQLKDLSITAQPAPLAQNFRAVSPVFNFSVTAEEGVAGLPDADVSRAGLQTRVVIELAKFGVLANDFQKFDTATQTWYSFLDDQDLNTWDDGATLLDVNGDGRVDRIVLTLTDGAKGDEDGLVNGTIVDPGLLAFDTTPVGQVYSVKLAGGDRYYTADAGEAAQKAALAGSVFEGVRFDAMAAAEGGRHLSAYYQPFTQDYTYAASGQSLPYACYGAVAGAAGFDAAAAGSGKGVDFHLYQDARGNTQLVTVAEAATLGLAAQGFTDRGAKFSATTEHAFTFDAEGYLIANQDNASVQALVQQLAATYGSTTAAGFVDAVEQNYLQQVQLVGVAHGAAATAADLNAVYGTHFTL